MKTPDIIEQVEKNTEHITELTELLQRVSELLTKTVNKVNSLERVIERMINEKYMP